MSHSGTVDPNHDEDVQVFTVTSTAKCSLVNVY